MENTNKKILLVEDDVFMQELVVKKLSKEHYDVEVVASGEDALKKIENYIPDLVLMDIVLPGMNGFTVLETIKKNKKIKDIPVILLSNLGQKEDLERGKNLGAEDYLVKAHFTLDEIAAKIQKILTDRQKI